MSKMSPRWIAAALTLACAVRLHAQVVVEGSPNKDLRARPGDRYAGVIVLRNNSADPQEVRLYQTDYETSADGKTLFPAAGTNPRSNSAWVSLGRSSVIVPARQVMELAYSVSVPNTPLSGSYWSMVMVEVVPRDSPASSMRGSNSTRPQFGVVTQLRQAVTVATTIETGARREARIEAPVAQVARTDSAHALQIDIRNTGNQAYAPKVRLDLYGPSGANVKSVSITREHVFPGNSIRETFPLGRLPHGKYRAIVTVDAGAGSVFGAQYAFTF
jgi:hypothetical protein